MQEDDRHNGRRLYNYSTAKVRGGRQTARGSRVERWLVGMKEKMYQVVGVAIKLYGFMPFYLTCRSKGEKHEKSDNNKRKGEGSQRYDGERTDRRPSHRKKHVARRKAA